MSSPIAEILDCEEQHLSAIQAIYAYYVEKSAVSFETEAPSVSEIRDRWCGVLQKHLPFIVAQVKGEVLGYAYVSLYRTRPAYRFTGEHSIYIRQDARGAGAGKLLMAALMERARAAGIKQLVASISQDKELRSSVDFHKAVGFVHVGVLREVGFKFGRWYDVALLQYSL